MSLLPSCLLRGENINVSGGMSPTQRTLRELAFCVFPFVVSNAARSGMHTIKPKSKASTSREAVRVQTPLLDKCLFMHARGRDDQAYLETKCGHCAQCIFFVNLSVARIKILWPCRRFFVFSRP